MDEKELVGYFRREYKEEELAEMLSKALLTGNLPPMPSEEVVRAPISSYARQTGRGRPNWQRQQELDNRIITILEKYYPSHMPLRSLAALTGLTGPYILRMAATQGRLARVPMEYRAYLIKIVNDVQSRLNGAQRAVLDLHNNSLVVAYSMLYNAAELPLYQWHWPLWGTNVPEMTSRQLARYDAYERKRAVRPELVSLIEQSSWWGLPARPMKSATEAGVHYEESCPVLQALMMNEELTVDRAIDLLIQSVPEGTPLNPPAYISGELLSDGDSLSAVRRILDVSA